MKHVTEFMKLITIPLRKKSGDNMEFRDLKTQYQRYKSEIDKVMINVAKESNFIMGKQVSEIEKQLAGYVGVKHCITCANGTDALTLAMMSYDIKEGDAVFVPDFTFFSTAEIVLFEGATPIFVDVDKSTFNIDTVKLEFAIEKIIKEKKLNPKAIIAVDLFGLPANYTELEKIALKYNIVLVEDAAQGFGGRIGNKKACSFGHIATTSFFPAKPLGCYGDGGAIFTDDDNKEKLLRSLTVHGKGENKYDNIRIGMNSRLDTIQAAVLKVKLKAFIEHELEDVNRAYNLYNEKLNKIVKIPLIPDNYYSSFAQYTIILESKKKRDKLQAHLKEQGIPSMIYYQKPMHKQLAFSKLDCNDENFKVTNMLCDCVLSLPMHPYLTNQDVELVCNSIKNFILRG